MFFLKTHFTQCTATSICTVSFAVTALIVLFSLTDLVVYSRNVGPSALDLRTSILSPQILFILKLIISPIMLSISQQICIGTWYFKSHCVESIRQNLDR